MSTKLVNLEFTILIYLMLLTISLQTQILQQHGIVQLIDLILSRPNSNNHYYNLVLRRKTSTLNILKLINFKFLIHT
jgi:hypothetical protein